jgi:hypothetical protein
MNESKKEQLGDQSSNEQIFISCYEAKTILDQINFALIRQSPVESI